MEFSEGKYYTITSNKSHDSLCYSNLARMPNELLDNVKMFETDDEFTIDQSDKLYRVIELDNRHFLLEAYYSKFSNEWVMNRMMRLTSLSWDSVLSHIACDTTSVVVALK